jgi:Spy/CpxP family protein refolding chaperone
MQVFRKQLLAFAALAAMGTISLCAQPMPGHRGFAKMATALNLTPDQQNQTKAIFQESHKSARQVRQQLRQTRQELQAAVTAGNSDQIQQLSASQGTEMGQLTAIRSTAMSKVFKILTPDQQQKFLSMKQDLRAARRAKG